MKGICPRCGRPISWIETRRVGNREYVYAIHYSKNNREQCYLGPSNGYIYATTTHRKEGLVLKGLNDPDRVLEYFERIVSKILIDERLRDEIKKRKNRYGALIKKLYLLIHTDLEE